MRLPASYLCKDKEATSIARLKSDRPVCSKGALWVTTVPGFFFFFDKEETDYPTFTPTSML